MLQSPSPKNPNISCFVWQPAQNDKNTVGLTNREMIICCKQTFVIIVYLEMHQSEQEVSQNRCSYCCTLEQTNKPPKHKHTHTHIFTTDRFVCTVTSSFAARCFWRICSRNNSGTRSDVLIWFRHQKQRAATCSSAVDSGQSFPDLILFAAKLSYSVHRRTFLYLTHGSLLSTFFFE